MAMRIALAAGVLCAAFAFPAFAGEAPPSCPNDAATAGMRARMKTLREDIDKIEWTVDAAERGRLMELHMKHMHEGLHEMRRRQIDVPCRLEMMTSMMETMIRREQVMQERGAR
jgi:hypothetical protein